MLEARTEATVKVVLLRAWEMAPMVRGEAEVVRMVAATSHSQQMLPVRGEGALMRLRQGQTLEAQALPA